MYRSIESVSNNRIKKLQKLIKSASFRRKEGLFVIEGKRLCMDAVYSGITVSEVYFSESFAEKHPDELARLTEGADGFILPESLLNRVSDTVTSQGVIAVCRIISQPQSMKKGGRYIAGENLQDPSNIGAVSRTAEALGCDGLILSSDCCDIYNPKVLRSSMGAIFRLPIFIPDDFTRFLRSAQNEKFTVYATVPDKNADDISGTDFSDGSIVVIGNEGNGITYETKELADRVVTIKMKGRAESLNAAAAAAILIYELTK